MSNQAKGYEVCDPDIDDEWTRVESASSAADAAIAFLREKDYDERSFDTGYPFTLLVRRDAGSHERAVKVRVVPAHFEVT